MSVKYSDKQKIEYYKKKAAAASRSNNRSNYKPRQSQSKQVVVGRGKYVAKNQNEKQLSVYNPKKSIGQQIGSSIGAGIGLGAEQFIRWVTGMGEYKVNSNVLLQSGGPPPIYNADSRGGTVVRHREYLGDIRTHPTTAGAFNLQKFSLNPGDERTFPWLSQIAANYEEYDLQGMIFEYRSMSADALNSTNTALGTVIMCTKYNAAADDFESKAEMENYQYGCSGRPSENLMHPIECARQQTAISTLLFTRGGGIPSGEDPRLYDWGNFFIATQGGQAANINIGELWVTYQVALLKPKLYANLGNDINILRYDATTYTNSTPLATRANSTERNNTFPDFVISPGIPGDAVHFDETRLYLPNLAQVAYSIEVLWQGGAVIAVVPAVTLSNCSFTTFYGGGPAVSQVPSGISTTLVLSRCTVLTDGTGVPAILTYGTGTLPTSGVMYCQVIQLPADQF